MTSGMPSLLDSIFGKQNLEEVSLEEIQLVITEFPSFNAAHFLLSKKLKLENNPAYLEQTMKTALYFNNPVWLQSLLEEDPVISASENKQEIEEYVEVQPVITVNEEYAQEEESVPTINQEYEEPQPAETINQEYTEAEEIESIINHQPSTINEEYEEPQPVETINQEYTEAQAFVPIINQEFNEEPQQEITVNEEYAQEEESVPTINQDFEKEPEFVQSTNFEFTESTINYQPSDGNREKEPEKEITADEALAEVQESVPFVNQEGEPSVNLQPSTVNQIPPFDARKAESIVFEPYHMIDYFASQGIKLVIEDHLEDSFGRQLKSFTDWLKVMKRLPNHPVGEKTDEREAERIRRFAANSIEERDILTETMAEVLAKQGMYENAISLYQKLSLIYPPKSAYFASRIEQLKASLS